VQGMNTCLWSHSVVCDRTSRATALTSHRSTYSLTRSTINDEGIQRAFAESIAANPDIALVDLLGVDLSPYVDVLGVSDELHGNCTILERVQAQRIAQQRVKSAKGGTR
jgi:hypothetical protein